MKRDFSLKIHFPFLSLKPFTLFYIIGQPTILEICLISLFQMFHILLVVPTNHLFFFTHTESSCSSLPFELLSLEILTISKIPLLLPSESYRVLPHSKMIICVHLPILPGNPTSTLKSVSSSFVSPKRTLMFHATTLLDL